jgi:hypothetical protein
MAQSPDDDDLGYYGEFQDIIAQRTMTFCSLAKVAAGLKDEAVREQCMAMMHKINASIRTPPSAEVHLVSVSKADEAQD